MRGPVFYGARSKVAGCNALRVDSVGPGFYRAGRASMSPQFSLSSKDKESQLKEP